MNETKVGFCSWGAIFTSFITNAMGKLQSPRQIGGLKKMSFWQVVKRFFEPAISMKWASLRAILRNFFLNISWPINALFIWIIWALLENWNKDEIFKWIFIYWLVLCTNHIVMELTKKRWRPETYYQQMKHIQDNHLPRYLQIDWNYLDKLWTWKLIAIISNWFEKWTSLITDSIGALMAFSVAFLSWFYFSSKLWWLFVVWYLILFILISVISILIDRPSRKLRDKRRDSMNDYSRSLVRFIMARVDIIQNNKIKHEIKNTWLHLERAWSYVLQQATSMNDYSRSLVRFIMARVDIIQNNKIKHEIKNTWLHLERAWSYVLQQATPLSRMFNIPKSLISIFRIIIIIFWSLLYLKWEIGIWEFSAMLWFMLLVVLRNKDVGLLHVI